jgi:N-acetylglutamate synthase-like GNAT family acetyltransferase
MMSAGISIQACRASDRSAALRLLADCRLTTAGLADHWRTTWVAAEEASGGLRGMVALEVAGTAALLRSLAVVPSERGSGLGRRLVEHALREAASRRVETVVLLTETADDFFRHLGFEPCRRDEISPSLHASAELRGACPQSARAWRRSGLTARVP